ncbi:MAG: response regulator, partial [Magnetococcales bacterium]|nr:response regulator [Magnetococcales bacterium]
MGTVILVVVASKSLAALFKEHIEAKMGIDVVVAHRAAVARRLIEADTSRFFLALVSIDLPDAPNGEMVDDSLAQGVPTIVLADHYDQTLQQRVVHKGGLDYFVTDNIGVVDAILHAIHRVRRNRDMRLVVVDDSRSSRQLVAKLLRRYGFTVLEADHGGAAMALLAQQGVQLVITDYQMPVMDGLQLVKKMRANYSRDAVAVIGLSSVENRTLATQFIKAGANDFLIKPFQPEELLCRVYQNIDIIDRHTQLQQLLEQHRSVLDNALDAIITIDAAGRITDYNRAAQTMFGYDRESVLHRYLVDIMVPEPFKQRHREALARRVLDPQCHTLQRRLEMPGLCADGRHIDLQIALIAIQQPGQQQE